MEAVGAAASILAIASAGIQISLNLIAFADRVATAAKRIQDVGTDVSVTAGTLQELGKLMSKTTPHKKSAAMFTLSQIQDIKASSIRCEEIFDELKRILSKASKQLQDVYQSPSKGHGNSPRIKLSRLEQMKWPFLQPSMEPLQIALRDAKSTLALLLQVVQLRHAQLTASLDREEQHDLIRLIAAMRRQQLVSVKGDNYGSKGLSIAQTVDSDSEESPNARVVLEAWSVIPNTFHDSVFNHLKKTQIPVSQQQMANLLTNSPQDVLEVASIIDSLSMPERRVILGHILDENRSEFEGSTIRSISSHSWVGTHELFGKVTGRKFQLVIERHIRKEKRPGEYQRIVDADSPEDGIYSDSEDKQRVPMYSREPRIWGPRNQRRPTLSNEGRKTRYDDEWRREQEIEDSQRKEQDAMEKEKRREEEMVELLKKEKMEREKRREEERAEMLKKAKMEKEEIAHRQRKESQATSEPSDDDLVKSLLAQYTNFKPGEPLVQSSVTPPPSYEETFVVPKRVPRPY